MAQITWIHLGRGGVRGQGSPPCVGTARVHLLLPAGQGLRDLREQSGHSSAPPAPPRPETEALGWALHPPPVGGHLQGSSPEVAQAALLQGPDTRVSGARGRAVPTLPPRCPGPAPAHGPYISN